MTSEASLARKTRIVCDRMRRIDMYIGTLHLIGSSKTELELIHGSYTVSLEAEGELTAAVEHAEIVGS